MYYPTSSFGGLRGLGVEAIGPGYPYTIARGDTLTFIAWRFGRGPTEWLDLYRANERQIGPDPDRIKIGQQLVLPAGWPAAPTTAASRRPSATWSSAAAASVAEWRRGRAPAPPPPMPPPPAPGPVVPEIPPSLPIEYQTAGFGGATSLVVLGLAVAGWFLTRGRKPATA